MFSAYRLLRPAIFTLPPEVVHNLGLFLLRNNLWPHCPVSQSPQLEVQAWGLTFKNPVGLAAGFDKNAAAINGLLDQGFGFVEAGTVTPLAQPGNPTPRIFRLKEDEAVINRLGFNNGGLDNYLRHFTQRDVRKGIAGANIGKNKDAVDAVADYVRGLKAVYAHADYVTINISSPNTQGLRALQERSALMELLSALQQARMECAKLHGKALPMLLKIAPDLELPDMDDIAEIVMKYTIDGVIISNTTISRPQDLRSPHRSQAGGLSGRPLLQLSNERLRYFYKITSGKLPLIGVGGIASAQDAYQKIRSGATLVQLYSALVYQGFSLVREINNTLPKLLAQDGFTYITEAIGVDAR